MTAVEQTMDRTQGLGGSDMAALLGVETFKIDGVPKNKLHVYLEKIGEAGEQEETEAQFWGTELEDKIAKRWADVNGLEVRRRNAAVPCEAHPWLRGHIDRKIVGRHEGVEIKLSSKDGWGQEGTDEIPENYLPQVHTYLTCTGWERWHIAALLWGRFGPPKLHHYVVERDEEWSGILIEAGERFKRDHWDPRIPPGPESSAQASRLWRRVDPDKIVTCTEDDLRLIGEREALKNQTRGLDKRIKNIELKLKERLEHAPALVDKDKNVQLKYEVEFSRRFSTDRFQQIEPDMYAEHVLTTHSRTLRVTKPGKEAAKAVLAADEKLAKAKEATA